MTTIRERCIGYINALYMFIIIRGTILKYCNILIWFLQKKSIYDL